MPPTDAFEHYKVNAFYHFTDTRNLPSIRETGGLYSWSELRRRKISVPKPGGNDWSHNADKRFRVDDYVHLCMQPRHPMEYKKKQTGHIGDTLFLEIDSDIRHLAGVMYAPDVSNKNGVSLIPILEAMELIDFQVLYMISDRKDASIKTRLDLARKCEILIPKHVPLDYIWNLPHG